MLKTSSSSVPTQPAPNLTSSTPSVSSGHQQQANPLSASANNTAAPSLLTSGVWTLTHHHHLHHHHHHHHRDGKKKEQDGECSSDEDRDSHSSAHHSRNKSKKSRHSTEDTSDTDSETTEEDSIELKFEDFQLENVDPDEYDVIELNIDELGLEKQDFATALSQEDVLEKLSRSLQELPALKEKNKKKKRKTTEDENSDLEAQNAPSGDESFKTKRKSRLSNVLIGMPKKIRIVRPKAVHNILNIVEKNTLQPIPKVVTVLSILCAISAIGSCFADILIEILMVTGAAYHLTFRLSYLFLVISSALIGFFVLMGIRHRELDMTLEAIVLGFVVETGLLASDFYYVFNTEPAIFPTLNFRLAFMITSVFNIFCHVVMFWKLHLAEVIGKLLRREWKKRIHLPDVHLPEVHLPGHHHASDEEAPPPPKKKAGKDHEAKHPPNVHPAPVTTEIIEMKEMV